MYQQILVAVDGSDTSNFALTEAIKLAKDQHAALRLVHVVDEITVYMMTETPTPIADYLKAMREAGQKILEPISKSFEEHDKASELHEAKEVLWVELPSNKNAALPLNPSEEPLN